MPGRYHRHIATIAQHGHLVAQAVDLLQVMGDIQDGQALIAQALDDTQQLVDLTLDQCHAGLIEHQDLWLANQCPGDLQHLALGAAQLAHQRTGRQLQVKILRQQPVRFALLATPIHKRPTA